MLNKLKELVKKNDSLYVIAKCVKNSKNPEMIKLIRGYYDFEYQEVTTLLIEHYGTLLPDRIIYDIPRGEETVTRIGFYADMHNLLYALKYSEMINAIPRVRWGEKMPYYDHGMDYITKNVFEYYFLPISEASNHSLYEYKNVIRTNGKHEYTFQNMVNNSYNIENNHIRLLAEIYKKYIHLNDQTSQFINDAINRLSGNLSYSSSKILGVHARGTDFNLGLLNHPNVVAPTEYLEKVREVFSNGKYDKIFIASEDSTIIDMFVSEFGDNVLFYDDVFRTSGKTSPHSAPNDRELNNYKLGLEVLRDVYTLAHCHGFVSGLSHVAFAVRYTNLALERNFDEIYTINKGINHKDSEI